MTYAPVTLFVLAGTSFLAVSALAVFAVLVVSIRRAERVPLSESRQKRVGIIAGRVLIGFCTGEEDAE